MLGTTAEGLRRCLKMTLQTWCREISTLIGGVTTDTVKPKQTVSKDYFDVLKVTQMILCPYVT
jgi:hypothetical protein